MASNDFQFRSPVAPLMERLIQEKQAVGYKYQTGIGALARVDRFLASEGLAQCELPRPSGRAARDCHLRNAGPRGGVFIYRRPQCRKAGAEGRSCREDAATKLRVRKVSARGCKRLPASELGSLNALDHGLTVRPGIARAGRGGRGTRLGTGHHYRSQLRRQARGGCRRSPEGGRGLPAGTSSWFRQGLVAHTSRCR